MTGRPAAFRGATLATADMLRLLGFLYSIGIWVTFGLLLWSHGNQCVGIPGCAVQAGRDFLIGVAWPFFWGGWIA